MAPTEEGAAGLRALPTEWVPRAHRRRDPNGGPPESQSLSKCLSRAVVDGVSRCGTRRGACAGVCAGSGCAAILLCVVVGGAVEDDCRDVAAAAVMGEVALALGRRHRDHVGVGRRLAWRGWGGLGLALARRGGRCGGRGCCAEPLAVPGCVCGSGGGGKGTMRWEWGAMRRIWGALRQERGALRRERGALRQDWGALRQEWGAVRHERGAMRQEWAVLSWERAGLSCG